MDLMEDPTFKTKYHKHKIRVKLWESDFMEKYGRKPNKNDIKAADMTIREAYKMYWKLKTRALEETLTEITFHKESLENVLPANTLPEIVENPINEEHKNEAINTSTLDLENSYSNDYLPKLTSTMNLTKKINLKRMLGQHLNLNQNYIKNDQAVIIDKSSSFQLSQKMFKPINFSKRNPRKSLSITKLQKPKIDLDRISNQTKKYKSEKNIDYEIPGILQSSLNNNFKIIYNEKKNSEPTIQQLIERYRTTYNRQLNKNWLNRCIDNDMFDDSISKAYRLSRDCDSEYESFVCIHSSNENLSTQDSLNNKSFTDDEDYIFNSDSEEERKNKRIRNFNQIHYDYGSQPSKRLCTTGVDSKEKYSDYKVLQHSLSDISKIRNSSDLTGTSMHEKSVDSINTNELKQINGDSEKKIMNPKKFARNTFKTKLKNDENYYLTYSKKKSQCLAKEIYFSENEWKNDNINEDNGKSATNQIPIKSVESLYIIPNSPITKTISSDLTDFSCFLQPLNQTNDSSMKHKSYAKQKFEQNLATRKLNENFIKINLKKKVFVRGKKFFNLSKYKKNNWKQQKKEIGLNKTGLKLADTIDTNNELLCFKCGKTEHFARYCKNFNGELLLQNINTDISSYSTLKEVEEMTKLNAVGVKHPSITDVGYQSILTVQLETIKHKKILNWKNSVNNTVIDNLNLVTYKESANLTKKLSTPQIQEIHPLYDLEPDYSVKDTPLEVLIALKKFGYNEFRSGQEKAIMRILSGRSTLVTLATGSGKSLCYQLPAYMYAKKSSCITLVISPLVSLMDDQISRIPDFLQAACLHTKQTSKSYAKILANMKKGKLNILLMSPELIIGKEKSSDLGNILRILPPIAFACIDEIHCISQWSHNFRPSYLMICKVLKEQFGVKRILGLTATASKSTVTNILNFLNIEDGMAGVISERPIPYNLNLTISRDQHREEALIKLVHSDRFMKCDSIIVYCTRRDECARVAKILRISLQEFKLKQVDPKTKISSIAEAYHAGLTAHRRKIVQDSFMKSKIRIIVATVAFGMGINKPNIRSVIHFNMPASFESYIQEIGRAGRDGLPAYCHLFLSPKENLDEYELRRHINADVIDRHIIRRLLQKIFIPCCCVKLYSKLHCQGHEVAFPIDETVKNLDISKEAITTLLCYLELHPKHFIKLMPAAYVNAKISSYKGPNVLKLAAQSSTPLAKALALSMKNGTYNDNSCTVEFPVIDIAAAIGLDSSIVKNQLKKLEWITVNGKTRKSSISVEFNTLGFRVIVFGNLTNEELDEALESLSQQNKLHIQLRIQQLKTISTTLRKFSFSTLNECFELNKEAFVNSEKLKDTICNYFELDDQHLSTVSTPLNIELKNEAHIVADIRNLILSYKEVRFTARSVARIFHGIQSPNYSALTWSKCRFWRAHLTDDFDAICQLASQEILKIKDMQRK